MPWWMKLSGNGAPICHNGNAGNILPEKYFLCFCGAVGTGIYIRCVGGGAPRVETKYPYKCSVRYNMLYGTGADGVCIDKI